MLVVKKFDVLLLIMKTKNSIFLLGHMDLNMKSVSLENLNSKYKNRTTQKIVLNKKN